MDPAKSNLPRFGLQQYLSLKHGVPKSTLPKVKNCQVLWAGVNRYPSRPPAKQSQPSQRMVFGPVWQVPPPPRTLPSLPRRAGAQTPDRTEMAVSEAMYAGQYLRCDRTAQAYHIFSNSASSGSSSSPSITMTCTASSSSTSGQGTMPSSSWRRTDSTTTLWRT